MENTECVVSITADTASQLYSPREDYLAKEVARLTTMNAMLAAEVEKLIVAANHQSIESLLIQALANKVPQAIEAEIDKQFNDFFRAEIERQVEQAISEQLETVSVDCEKTVEEAIAQTLERVRIEFGYHR